MAFIVHTLTNLGASMIASATAGNKLIIKGCALSNNQYTQAAAQQLTYVYSDSWTQNITASAVENRLEARATFLRSQGDICGGNWYSMILFGRMASDGIAARKPIAVIVSDTQFYIPEVNSSISDVSVIFRLGFNIDINTIQVPVETLYALNSAFETLKDIAVTTHNFNDPSLGDAQDIKGDKYFVRAIGSDAGLETSEVDVNDNNYIIRSSKFEPEINTFRHIIAEAHDTTNSEYRGVYLDKDDTDEMTFTTDAEHVYLPGLVSDRTDYYYIGCITLISIYVGNVTPLVSNLSVGRFVEWVDDHCQIYAAKWDVTNHNFASDTTAQLKNMKFRLMSSCDIAKLGTSFALAMRVE